jgi:hypothetical protein
MTLYCSYHGTYTDVQFDEEWQNLKRAKLTDLRDDDSD